MKKNLKSILAIAVVATGVIAVSMYSCEKENIQPNNATEEVVEKDITTILPDAMSLCGEITKTQLVSAQSGSTIGTAFIYNNKSTLWVVLYTKKGAYMKNAYLEIAEKVSDLPVNIRKNQLMFDKFTYRIDAEPASNVRVFKVPMKNIRNKTVFSAMVQIRTNGQNEFKERAWIQGKIGFNGGGQAFNHVLDRCRPDFEDPEFEPANPPMQQETAVQDEIRNNKKPRVD